MNECIICTFEKKDKIYCEICKKDVCLDCFSKIETCPFCRNPYDEDGDEDIDLATFYILMFIFFKDCLPLPYILLIMALYHIEHGEEFSCADFIVLNFYSTIFDNDSFPLFSSPMEK